MSDTSKERQDASQISVLIAEDHVMVREGLRGLLEIHDDFVVVGEASTGAEAVLQAKELKPMILLLDLIMPEMGGV